MTTIINVFGAPGVGKSTFSALLFAKMKQVGFDCELVQEFAKEIVYADNKRLINDQLIVVAEQYRRTFVLDGKTDYIITDSPILLAPIYNKLTPAPYPAPQFDEICKTAFNKFNNLNILLLHNPTRTYQQNGRVQNKEQSLMIERQIVDLLKKNNISCLFNPTPQDVICKLQAKTALHNPEREV